MQVPHKVLQVYSNNMGIVRKLFVAVMGQKFSAVPQFTADLTKQMDIVYELRSETGKKLDIALTAEERKTNV